jgi:hypothetical protein
VRFAVEGAAPLRIDELNITAPWVRRHRDLPISRVENAANADANLRAEISLKSKNRAPADRNQYVDLAQRTTGTRFTPELRYRLKRPAKRRLPEGFYAQVARAYLDAVAAGMNPRKTLAADSGVPADTVARWILKARKDGHLPPTTQGKVLA